MQTDSVVITGLGTLGSCGVGTSALAAALAAGRPRVAVQPDPAGYRRRQGVSMVALCGDLDLGRWLNPARARRMSAPSRFAVASARMALEAAGIPAEDAARQRSVALATTFGAGVFTEKLLVEILDSGPRTASPFLFTDCVANAPAGQVAIDLHATGPNSTVVQREAGPLLALIEGARDVALGRTEVCLAGHVDEIGTLVHAVLDRMLALCQPDADGELRPRPFGQGRRGFLAGEGSTVVVLEREATARARGAKPLARIAATARAFDPTAPRADWGHGAAVLAERLRQGLARSGLTPRDLGAVVSGASGSVRGDALEANVLRALFGAELPPIVAPKAVTGEYGGSNLAAAVLALGGAKFGRPPGWVRDTELGVVLHDGALPPIQNVLVSDLAAGGAAAWVVLQRPE